MADTFRYSEAFKIQVVRELEEGKHRSCRAAREAYGIRGKGTVQRWVREYGKEHLLGKVIRVETADERSELKRLKDRVSELEGALVDAHLDLRLEKAWFELACEAGGIGDTESFKKKHGGGPCTGSQNRQRSAGK